MRVTVKLFARARDLAGRDAVTIDVPPAASVAQVRGELAQQAPALTGFVSRCAVAIDGEYAFDEQIVPEDAELALIPPVSGG